MIVPSWVSCPAPSVITGYLWSWGRIEEGNRRLCCEASVLTLPYGVNILLRPEVVT